MSRRNSKNSSKKNDANMQTISKNIVYSKDELMEIQEEAYYRAIKRIEQEKEEKLIESNKQTVKKEKRKWQFNVLLFLNVLLCPWKINKKFNTNKSIHEYLLVAAVSGIMGFLGLLCWLFGGAVVIESVNIIYKNWIASIILFVVGLLISFFGSAIIISGNTFENENDSNKIYAYSAAIFSLVSCIIAVTALLNT